MNQKRKPYLHDLTYKEVPTYLQTCDVVKVPISSLERHGAHLPLGCDALTTWEVVTQAA